jgi:hypothetical protein
MSPYLRIDNGGQGKIAEDFHEHGESKLIVRGQALCWVEDEELVSWLRPVTLVHLKLGHGRTFHKAKDATN